MSPTVADGQRWRTGLAAGASALVLVLLLVGAIASGAAALLETEARRMAAGPEPELDAARAALARARRCDPIAPHLLLLDGQLLERQAATRAPKHVEREHVQRGLSGRGDSAPGERERLLAQAQARYRTALARQPTWPYTSAALVRVQLLQGGADTAIAGDLARALRTGRWEPGVQRSLIRTALAAWPALSPTQQDQFVDLIAAAVATQPTWVMGTAVATGRWPVLAPVIDQLAREDPGLAALARPYAARALPRAD